MKRLLLLLPLLLVACNGPAPEPKAATWNKAKEICIAAMEEKIAESLNSKRGLFKSSKYTERNIINYNCETVQSDKWKQLGSVRGYVNYMEIGLCSDGRQCGDPKLDQVYMFYGVSFPWETFGDKE